MLCQKRVSSSVLLQHCPCCILSLDAPVPPLPGKDFSWHKALGSHHVYLTMGTYMNSVGEFLESSQTLISVWFSLRSSTCCWQKSLHKMVNLTIILIILTIAVPPAAAANLNSFIFQPREMALLWNSWDGIPVGCKEGLLHLAAQLCYWNYPGLNFFKLKYPTTAVFLLHREQGRLKPYWKKEICHWLWDFYVLTPIYTLSNRAIVPRAQVY